MKRKRNNLFGIFVVSLATFIFLDIPVYSDHNLEFKSKRSKLLAHASLSCENYFSFRCFKILLKFKKKKNYNQVSDSETKKERRDCLLVSLSGPVDFLTHEYNKQDIFHF